MSITPNVYSKVRGEIVTLFGWNADSLTPDQVLRIDCAVALRIGLDDLQGRVMRGDGESVDMAKMLTASEALSRLLPPPTAPPQLLSARAARTDPPTPRRREGSQEG
jgi:hypothetical protein